MKSRALRFALVTLFVGVVIGAAYVMWNEESEGRSATAAAVGFEDRVRLVSRSLLEIKSAQPGYVAVGQGEDFWVAKIDGLLGPARDALAALRLKAGSPQSASEIETAAAAFEDFEQMDRRAREYARGGQRLLASDLVFSDGIEKVDAALAALNRARDIELGARDASLQQHRRAQMMAAAASAAAGLLVVLLLAPLPREHRPVQADKPVIQQPAGDYPISSQLPIAPAPPPAPVAVTAPPPPTPPLVDLPGIASLCTDLARVPDPRALPAALERAATLLDASGIVVWIADPDGRELAPIVAYGYPQTLVARMGIIERAAENVTAAAFRTGLVQTVRSDSVSHGAIAAPLLTPSGPVGVMAAEILNDGERRETTRAAASIVAAQLATLMAPPSSRTHGKAEVAG